ncbi:MAG: hypothetical protein EBS84_10240 [Proteobacteria bacterium]|nr:hypothetical protein [Verrucomicrobiota bacterium]NBU09381.1 hypothetical protein [Pseudomonadota bacterium]
MKTSLTLLLSAGLVGSAFAQTPPATPATPTAPASPVAPPTTAPAKPDEPRPPVPATAPVVVKEPVKRVNSDTEKGMRLNFRGVPLEQVLDYFGEAAGFIIVPKVDIRGRVDVWSNDPLTKDEAVEVLNNVLSRNGFTAFRSGRTLNIINRDEAKQRPLPTKVGGNPENIPSNEEMVTQILPVKFISAEQLIKNLEMLLPTSSTLTANAGANALIITDVQSNIKRVAEIIKGLDTPVSSVSAVKVFTLKYADAKSLATVVKDLFAPDTSRGANGQQQGGVDPRQQFFQSRFGGGGATGGGNSRGDSGGRVSTPKVVASADELSNSLIVSAPEEQMTIVEDLVKQVDVPVEDVAEIRVFKLKYANAQETADMLKNLFPDLNSTGNNNSNNRGGFRGGFFGGFGGGTAGTTTGAAGQSQRALKQNRVVAVADARTSSVLVTASATMMEQIARMIEQLDGDPAKQQKVFVIPVENADPAQMQQILQSLFPSQNTRSTQSSSASGRSGFGTGTTTRNNGGNNTGGRTGSSGFGGTGSSGVGGRSGFGTGGN